MWVSCHIKTDSHRLNEEAFSTLMLPESSIRVSEVTENGFRLSSKCMKEEGQPAFVHLHHGHHALRCFVIALNIGTCGMFYWCDEPWAHPILHISESPDGDHISTNALIVTSDNPFERKKVLREVEVESAIKIFGMLARQPTELEVEYTKGLLLLRMNFYDVNFRKEAFLCFYRALENFIATRILCVKKLENELKDLQRAISMVGLPDFANEVKEIYKTRSSQVAHFQTAAREISLDEVLKTKVFLDFVMHKTLKAEADQIMLKTRQSTEPPKNS